MGVLVKYLFFAVTVISVGLSHGYDPKSNFRKIDLLETKLFVLETKLDVVVTELKYVKEDLKEEKDKFIKFENQLKDENIDSLFDDKDNDLTRSEPVVNEHREISNVSSFIEQRIYQAFHDEKNLRKQFQNQMQTAFKTEKKQSETKFIALQETLSAFIDRKLVTLENEVRESIAVLNTSISSIENLTKHVQQNDESITSLIVETDQLNTTLLRLDALLYSLNDTFVDVQTSVDVLLDNSDRLVCLHGGKHSTEGLCECDLPYYGTHCEKECSEIRELYYTDCYDIQKHTDKPTGIYTVAPRGSNKTIEVKCDMDINGGGWTVFQYRHDGSVDFYKKFDAYEHGFGSVTGEFWLGLQYIHVMTSSDPTVLRIDVAAADGTTAYQTYDDFYISEGPDYILNVGATSGTAGDDGSYRSLSYNNGQPFSTYDRDRDSSDYNCAEILRGAWWYEYCGVGVNLNSPYATPGTTSTIWNGYGGMIYYLFKGKESLKSSKIMFRRT